MVSNRSRHGITSGAVVALMASVIAAGLVVFLALDAGGGSTLPSAANTPLADSSATMPVTASPDPIQALPPSTLPPVPDIPDEEKPEAKVLMKPATIQLGYVEPGSVKRATVEVINQSDVPLNLTGAKRGCSCTEVELTPGIIPPGGSKEITAIFTAGLTPTVKTNKVGVLFEKFRSVQVPMKATVCRKVRAVPPDFRMQKDGAFTGPVVRDKGRIRLSSIDGRPFRVLSAGGQPPIRWPGFSGDPTMPSTEHEVAVDIGDHDKETLLDPEGNLLPPFWVFETDHPDAPVVEVRIMHQAHRPHQREKEREWVFVENRVVVDAVPPGGSTTFELPIIWSKREGRTQQIHEVVSISPEFSAELIGMRADGRRTKAIVRITPAEDLRGPYQGTVEFISREHRAPLTIIGYVKVPDADGDNGP